MEPAFPIQNSNMQGLTKREYFAAQLFLAVVAIRENLDNPEELAKKSFELADALLAESKK